MSTAIGTCGGRGLGKRVLADMRRGLGRVEAQRVPASEAERILALIRSHGQDGEIRGGVCYGFCDIDGAKPLPTFRSAYIWLGY